jgi:putative FmdB family regulatory protein
MPTYEYACPKCGIVEIFQSIKEKALTRCPTCKKAKVQRMVSVGAGIIFKGSGFWETDYNRSADYQKKSKDESAPATSDEGVTQPKTATQTKKADPAPASTTAPASPPPAGPATPAPAPTAPVKPPKP